MKVFGCVAYSRNRNSEKSTKFDPKATKCIFIGYPENSTAYMLLNLKTQKVFVSRNVRFNENHVPGLQKEPEEIEDSFLMLDLDKNDSQDNTDISVKDEQSSADENEDFSTSESENEQQEVAENADDEANSSQNVEPHRGVIFNPIVKVEPIPRRTSKISVPEK